AEDVLSKVLDIPITTWRFKSEDDEVKHIGPVAQDFMASFGYGSSDKHITSTDADGVALAAIQGLNQKLTQELADVRAEKQTEIDRLKAELAKHDVQFASIEQRLLAMEASMN
ncbi:MAG: tail fiber domain-containing protein, partial [Candidatus Hydrogenedentota bacterium]